MAGIHSIKRSAVSTAGKFDWQASEGAPLRYPMQIISGSFYSPNGDSLYVPDGATLHNGWGDGRSSHVVGEDLKSLPDRLSITFFSYTENQFYSGQFTLPYQKILALFQAGHYSPNEEGHITYDVITVGVAPGGAVSVWLVSIDKTVEIFFDYATKEKGDWKSIVDNPDITREEFIQLEVQESLEAEQLTPEAITALNKKGISFGLWENYHKLRYNWQPLFINIDLLEKRIGYIRYYNGERGFIDIPEKQTAANATRAVPSEMVFIWKRPPAKPLRIKLFFNEEEIFAAFKKLGSNNKSLQFEMRMEIVGDEQNFSIWLKNETESLVIEQTRIETYGIPE